MNCPFCHQELAPREGNQRCDKWECWYHTMPRYIRYHNSLGMLIVEKIVLTDTIYVVIDHVENTTTISKLDVVVISDHVKLSRALKLDLEKYQAVVDKIKTLLILS